MNVKKTNTIVVRRYETQDVKIICKWASLRENISINGLQTMVDVNMRLRIE